MVTVSDTAYAIAMVRAEEGARPSGERLFLDDYARLFVPEDPEVVAACQRFLDLPFFKDGIRLRTRFIDDYVNAAIRNGIEQVVILGAGFDMRAYRLKSIRELAGAWEIDTQEILSEKYRLLQARGVPHPERVGYVWTKFTTFHIGELVDDLDAQFFKVDKRAVFVWEGVISYIDLAMIEASLRFMADAGRSGARLVFTFFDGAFAPFTLAEVLARSEWKLEQDLALTDLWRRYGLAGEPHPGAAFARIGTATLGGG